MIKHIKTILTCLTVGLAFVSCNNNFEDDMPTINYPEKVELGMWKNLYVTGTTSYTVNITLNAEGDTICDVTTYNSATNNANVLDGGKVSYDPRTGVMTAEYDNSMYETPARVTVAWKNNLQNVTVCLYSVVDGTSTSKGVFSAERANTISVYGDWSLADGSVLTLAADGTASLLEGENVVSGTYSYEGTAGTVSLDDGKSITLSLNDKGQMFASVNGGEAAYASHIMTQPKDDWYDYADGTYTSWLFGDISGLVLQYSPSRSEARIQNIIEPGSEISFYWNIGEEEVTFTDRQYNTYYTYYENGQEYGEVYFTPVALDDTGRQAKFEDNVFTFGMSYQIPGVGGFGSDVDAFTITNIVE